MSQRVISRTVCWQGRFCGRRGNNGQPVAGGCDFHDWRGSYEEVCLHNLGSAAIPLKLDADGHTLRCDVCLKLYGED